MTTLIKYKKDIYQRFYLADFYLIIQGIHKILKKQFKSVSKNGTYMNIQEC